MTESSWEPLTRRSSLSSPTRMSLQEHQYQRQSEQLQRQADIEAAQHRRTRGSHSINHVHETDFLMSSIVVPPASTPTSPHPKESSSGNGWQSSPSSPRNSFGGRGAIGNMLDVSFRRGASSIIDTRHQAENLQTFLEELRSLELPAEDSEPGYGAINSLEDDTNGETHFQELKENIRQETHKKCSPCKDLLGQIPAITIASLLNLMMAIPFGVAYFPIGWGGGDERPAGQEGETVAGSFPLPGKEQLGIRITLFSTIVGQIVLSSFSKFESLLAYNMVENLAFTQALAYIVIENQGYGRDALSTLFFLFGLSSVITGIFFYLLGRLDLGRIVYFFPNHVLVGCIGGIGVFITLTAIEVTNNAKVTFDRDGLQSIVDNFHLLAVVVAFEAILRVFIWKSKSQIPLLAPIYFCCIPLVFYVCLWTFKIDFKWAEEAGFFFPAPSDDDGSNKTTGFVDFVKSAFNLHTFDLFRVIDIRTISWTAVVQSSGTLIALAAFSLIHVPINIPAFSISLDLDTDMNAELMAHGYSNLASGLFGGLANYMTYSNSLLYAKSKGKGKLSSFLVAFMTFVFFVFGPELAIFIPRCMAGTLLLHIGLDLFLEGVVDSYYDYDNLEYAGIWAITLVMTVFGMTAALIAGIIAALSVYAAQSIAYSSPIREIFSAKTLRSSVWTRPAAELAILNDDLIGRSRVLVVQLQGHLFFGNVAQMTDRVKEMLSYRQGTDLEPFIVALDFSLIMGLDSSAAHAIAKMNNTMHRRYHVAATVFVTGPNGFPCEYALSEALSKHPDGRRTAEGIDGLRESLSSIGHPLYCRNLVCDNLDDALIFAEDVLIARQDPSLLKRDQEVLEPSGYMTPADERRLASQQLANLFPYSDDISRGITILFSHFEREEYSQKEVIWQEGAESDCAKLLVKGELIAYTEGGANTSMATERVPTGNIVGELGLVQGTQRLSTVECVSEKAVLYNLSLANWIKIKNEHPRAALCLEEIVIRYLSSRVQHVGRIFQSRCLPV